MTRSSVIQLGLNERSGDGFDELGAGFRDRHTQRPVRPLLGRSLRRQQRRISLLLCLWSTKAIMHLVHGVLGPLEVTHRTM